VGKIVKNQSEGKYSAMKIQCHIVKKIHSNRLLFRRFCPLGIYFAHNS